MLKPQKRQQGLPAASRLVAPLKVWLDEQNKAKGYAVGW